ncbi:sensor histidine kinase [Sinosporangium siamense]|uniref:histidine kinase n=1 Tax=Sinosporangium siamense TaxID=1367973 RepID=A0A919V5X6_9ACTN|nr:histidine kinase [Sinosporangium siamense]GII91923.1 hypothetical protein Ssi02_21540 [Sinosporangium siamense]
MKPHVSPAALPWPDLRAFTADAALATAVGFVGVTSTLVISGAVPMRMVPTPPGLEVWAQVIAAAALLFRRRHPLAVVALIVPLGYAATVPVALPFALYSLGAYRGDRRLLITMAVLTLVVTAHLWETTSVEAAVQLISVSGLAVVPATLLGLYVDSQRRLHRALAERAERAEREQMMLIEQARSEERTRLAREMHDVVTHHVSLMVLQAGSLRMTAPTGEVRDAAEELRATGRRALSELREVVGVLHDPGPAALAPPPSLLDVSRLVTDSGMRVELHQDDGITLSPALGRTAYRVVQEALTNARKHAPGAAVAVRLKRHDGLIRVSVSNSPTCGPPLGLPASSGTGLLGLRQRVELMGGGFQAGTTPDGGFEVVATLPEAA